jgi:NADPH2:quinone reductase
VPRFALPHTRLRTHTRSKYQEKPPLPFVPGGEVSGTVIAVGKSVATLSVGDAVLAVLPRFGGFAEEVRAAASDCFKLPPVRRARCRLSCLLLRAL